MKMLSFRIRDWSPITSMRWGCLGSHMWFQTIGAHRDSASYQSTWIFIAMLSKIVYFSSKFPPTIQLLRPVPMCDHSMWIIMTNYLQFYRCFQCRNLSIKCEFDPRWENSENLFNVALKNEQQTIQNAYLRHTANSHWFTVAKPLPIK